MPNVELYALDENASEDGASFDVITDDYCPVLPQLLPQGFAWRFKRGGLMDKLYCALSREYSRVERRGRDLLEETDPRTTQELLPDWERVLGLPGACSDPPTTIDGRRAGVLAKLTGRSSSSRPYFLALAQTLGYPNASITSLHRPFVCGTSRCGDPLQGHHGGWTYAWQLDTFVTGENDGQLQCRVRETAQAPITVYFVFPGQPTIVAVPGE